VSGNKNLNVITLKIGDFLSGNITVGRAQGAAQNVNKAAQYRGTLASASEVTGKGKAFPLQAWRGPWDSQRLRLQNF
jgi:hypothetical protein